MKHNELREALIKLGPELLADQLIANAKKDRLLFKELKLLTLKSNPSKLAPMMRKEINAIINNHRFLAWNQVYLLTDKLYLILHNIEANLLPEDPQLATELIEILFKGDLRLYERVDDSTGKLSEFYFALSILWGEAWSRINNADLDILPQKIYQLLLNNACGTKDYLIHHSRNALSTEGLRKLEQLIEKNENAFESYSVFGIKKAIADALDDVDKYINLIRTYSLLNESTICDIAERLIKKWRGAEAIDWLLHQPNDVSLHGNSQHVDPKNVTCTTRYDLLLKAYESETMLEELHSLYWLLFKKSLNKKYYEGLIQYQEPEKVAEIKRQALNFVHHEFKGEISTLLLFFFEIQAYDEIETMVINNFETLEVDNYPLYRPLSKALAAAGYPLSACLLRRKLITGILEKAQSKYYKYAISDFKIAQRYAEQVTNWHEFSNQQNYIAMLKKAHPKKHAFWSQLG